MTTANRSKKTRSTTIVEDYRHPRHLGGRGLRYFVHCKTGQHVVVMDDATDEPTIKRFATVEEARVEWKRMRGQLATEGFVRM